MSTTYPALFEPSQIGTLNIRNRLAVAPMTRVSAQQDGRVGPLMKAYYERFAAGGFGMIITEGLYTDELYSQGYYGQAGIASQEQAQSWQPVVAGVHAKGTVIIAQLMHAGALSQYNRFTDKTAGPSAVQPIGEQMSFYTGEGPYPIPEVMTAKDIDDAIQGFVNSAKLAQSAGFDGIEIHGANGYLLDQFLTDYTNQREDGYGGSISNRLRIFREVIDAVRSTVGESFVIGIRFSQKKVNDTEYVWPEGEALAQQTFGLMHECGVNYIHTTEPVLNKPAFEGSATLASLAKKYSGLPVIANGGVSKPDLADVVLKSGQADLVALGKIALANPGWPELVKTKRVLREFDFAMLAPRANLDCEFRYYQALERY